MKSFFDRKEKFWYAVAEVKAVDLSFAPMEGLSYCEFRSVHARFFPGVEQYCAPFLAPDGQGKVKASALKDLLPEKNAELRLIPQILCNSAGAFLALSRELEAMGYKQVDLNAGCPSGTVVPKHKGAGMLLDLNSLDAFLEELFSHTELSVSVKTRLGLSGVEEFAAVLEVYNRYPFSELTVHARTRDGLYQSTPDLSAFALAMRESRAPVRYNGNILSPVHAEAVRASFPDLERLMIGRGAMANPALFRLLKGGNKLEKEELRAFLEELFAAYLDAGIGEHYSINRMKELWYYVHHMFPGGDREWRRINKARTREDYSAALRDMFASGRFDPDAAFPGAIPK